MQLTNNQERGLKEAILRYKNHEKYTVISGFAGTGKSTLIRFIIEALPIREEDVIYATYTGKAAQVLAKKGNSNVSTLHKLLYKFYPRPDGTFYRIPRTKLNYKVVIIDEVSMVPKSMIDLLFQYNDIYIICFGDPMQIPPIHKEEDNHLLDSPHIFLDEIMRQEEESEIVRLSMAVRNHESIKDLPLKHQQVQILPKTMLNTGMLSWADEILVGTNKTRKNINDQIRSLRGITSDLPQEGDKVICSHNYWEYLSNQENSLINGTIGILHNIKSTKRYLPRWTNKLYIDVTTADLIEDEEEQFNHLAIDTNMLITGEKCVEDKMAYRLMANPKTHNILPFEFNYGYAITVHRAQGSEWDKVLVIEENFPFDREEHTRWLYTAITRAASKIVLIY